MNAPLVLLSADVIERAGTFVGARGDMATDFRVVVVEWDFSPEDWS